MKKIQDENNTYELRQSDKEWMERVSTELSDMAENAKATEKTLRRLSSILDELRTLESKLSNKLLNLAKQGILVDDDVI